MGTRTSASRACCEKCSKGESRCECFQELGCECLLFEPSKNRSGALPGRGVALGGGPRRAYRWLRHFPGTAPFTCPQGPVRHGLLSSPSHCWQSPGPERWHGWPRVTQPLVAFMASKPGVSGSTVLPSTTPSPPRLLPRQEGPGYVFPMPFQLRPQVSALYLVFQGRGLPPPQGFSMNQYRAGRKQACRCLSGQQCNS